MSVAEFRRLVRRGLTPEQEAKKWEFIRQLKRLESITCGAKDKRRNKYGAFPELNVASVRQTREVIKLAENIHKKFLG